MTKTYSIPVECKLSTTEQSRRIDSETILEFGIDGFTLMELAAFSAAKSIKNLQGTAKSGLFVCGKGNNSGDALATARYLINDTQHSAVVCFVLGSDDLSANTETNLSLLRQLKEFGADIEFIEEFQECDIRNFDYVVDGIFGTGLNSDLRGELPDIVEQVNTLSIPVYSMDIPSGMHADTGKIFGACIVADYTFTFGSNKIGLHWKSSRKYTGDVVFCNLPFPSAYRNWEAVLLDKKLMNSLPAIQRRARHKYDGGVVHIMAGSEGLTGAAIMASKSAWKQGAGAVFLYSPKSLLPIYESNLPNVIKIGVGKDSDSWFREEHAERISNNITQKKGVLLAGPGIGTRAETGDCLISVLKKQSGASILDADALSFWDQMKSAEITENQKKRWLFTPHIGEAKKYLLGTFQNSPERFNWAQEFTRQSGISLLTKGNPTIVTIQEGENFITGYDTSDFSRAGFGDVLSGSLAANISITNEMELAAVTSLYIGYKKSRELSHSESFGPEHLL